MVGSISKEVDVVESNQTQTATAESAPVEGDAVKLGRTYNGPESLGKLAPEEVNAMKHNQTQTGEVEAVVAAKQQVQHSHTPPTLQEIEVVEPGSDSGEPPLLMLDLNTSEVVGVCNKAESVTKYLASLRLDSKTHILYSQMGVRASDMRLLQLYLWPLSIGLLFVGSKLLLPVWTLGAFCLGIFCAFHFASEAWGGLGCPMKLAASIVAACMSALAARLSLKFGVFAIGAVVVGGASFLLFGAVCKLRDAELGASHLSSVTWAVSSSSGLLGGMLVLWNEEAALELLTAVLGGMGSAYSLYIFALYRGVELHRFEVFSLGFALALLGWKFQRCRRFLVQAKAPSQRFSNSEAAQQRQKQGTLAAPKGLVDP